MRLKRLELRDFRNYAELELDVGAGVNILLGPNAQGKTNLLEAIHVLALARSHRTASDRELIAWDRDEAGLKGEVERRRGNVTLELELTARGKKARVNGLEQRKLSNFVGRLNVVLFAPEDLDIVKGAPGVRRRFMDMEIGQTHPGYLHDLLQYHRVLQQRNRFLKTADPSRVTSAELDVWNEQLAAYGVRMMRRRERFIRKIRPLAGEIHAGVTRSAETLTVEYKPSFGTASQVADQDDSSLIEQFMIMLTQSKEQEFRRGVTLVGPHRDDVQLLIDGRDAQSFGSQGQQRTAALSLKLAELELMREEIGEYPLLLLDDVLSELDPARQAQLVEAFRSRVQTFITTTSLDGLDLGRLEDAVVCHVRQGRLST
jgi:DNA replication and repair protein RecF